MHDMMDILSDVKLNFNINYPNFEECYADGYANALAGLSETENPYLLNSKENEQWLEGWWAATFGEEPLYSYADDEHVEQPIEAANDHIYHGNISTFFTKLLEITGVLAVSAIAGYQVLDLVA